MTSLPGEQEGNLGKKPKHNSSAEIIIIAISKCGRKSYDKQGRDKCDLYKFNLFSVCCFFFFLPVGKLGKKIASLLHSLMTLGLSIAWRDTAHPVSYGTFSHHKNVS